MPRQRTLTERFDIAATLHEMRVEFDGPKMPKGTGLDFGPNRETFARAVGALRLDLLLADPNSGVHIHNIMRVPRPGLTNYMGRQASSIRGVGLANALDAIQACAPPEYGVSVESSIFIGHGERGQTFTDRSVIELFSRWSGAGLQHEDEMNPETITQVVGQVEDPREGLERILEAMKSRRYEIAPPTQSYSIAMGRAVIDSHGDMSGVSADHWIMVHPSDRR